MVELGGEITLDGFSSCDFSQMIVVKKLVGQYARKFNDTVRGFSHLTLILKSVGTNKFEVHGKCEVDGTLLNAEVTERNLFIALDTVLKKLQAQMK